MRGERKKERRKAKEVKEINKESTHRIAQHVHARTKLYVPTIFRVSA